MIPFMPVLAQIDSAQMAALEQDLISSAGTIGAIYGVLVFGGLIALVSLVRHWRRVPPPLHVAVSRFLDLPWRGGDLLWLFAVLTISFAATFFFRRAWMAWGETLGLTESSSALLVQSIAFHVVGFLTVMAILIKRRWTWQEAFGMKAIRLPADFIRGAVALLAVLPVLLVVTLLFHLLLQLLGVQVSLQDVAFAIADEPQRWMRVYFAVLAIGIAPFFEEIFFRGLLLPILARRFGTWVALLFTALLFASIHGHLPSFFTLFGLALAMGGAYILTGSLTVSIAMHGLFNAITVAILMSVP